MLFSFNIYSSLLLIFFFHTLVYSVLCFVKSYREKRSSHFWLGSFLFLSAWYISPWMLGFAGWYDEQPYRDVIFYVPFQHLYLYGPIIYFYVQSLLNPGFKFKQRDWLHFVPAAAYLLYSLVIVVTDKLIVGDYYFLADGRDRDFDTWYQYSGFAIMVFYFILSIRYYNRYRSLVILYLSNADELSFKWVRNFLFTFLAIIIIRFVFAVMGSIFDFFYTEAWWYFLSYALCCYYIAIAGFSNAVISKLVFARDLFQTSNEVLVLSGKQPLYLTYNANDFVEVEDLELEAEGATDHSKEEWKQELETLILSEKLYEDPELSLLDLAKRMNTNISLASRYINKGFGLNFNDLINKYRVEAVIDLLKKGEHHKQTLLSLAFEAGFNSKTTFNRSFKKHTGFSPQEYIKQKSL